MRARSLIQLNSQQRSDCLEEWHLVAKTTVHIFSHIVVTIAETKTCKYHTQIFFFSRHSRQQPIKNIPVLSEKLTIFRASNPHILFISKLNLLRVLETVRNLPLGFPFLDLCSFFCFLMVKLKRLLIQFVETEDYRGAYG